MVKLSFLVYFVQKKRKICEAIRKVHGGVTEVLGTFIQELAFAEDGDPVEQV
jgi:hypothetical protein